MTTNLNVLPERVEGSLGVEKVDPGWAADHVRQILLGEWNVGMDWIKELAAVVGVQTGAAWDSLRGIAAGDTLDWHEHWIEGAVADMHRWKSAIAPPTPIGRERAGLSFPLDSVGGIDFAMHALYFTRAQTPFVRCRFMLDGNPATHFRVYFGDATTNEGWGIKFLTAGTKIQGFTRTGGVDTDTDVDTWVASTEVVVTFFVLATHLYVSVGGGTPKDCGVVPADAVRLMFVADAAGAVGKVCETRNLLVRANWSA